MQAPWRLLRAGSERLERLPGLSSPLAVDRIAVLARPDILRMCEDDRVRLEAAASPVQPAEALLQRVERRLQGRGYGRNPNSEFVRTTYKTVCE